jgi:hypothetical protein
MTAGISAESRNRDKRSPYCSAKYLIMHCKGKEIFFLIQSDVSPKEITAENEIYSIQHETFH